LPDTSEAILGETLNVMGLTWLKEIFMVDHLLSRLAETVTTWHHTVGLTAQEAGYYIDVKTSQCSITSKHNEPADWQAHFKGHALIASAFEHGMLEQLMGSGSPGISTMKLFQIANTGGGRVYSVNKDNFAQIKPYLSNYSQTDLNSFQSQASNGYTLILPANGQLALGQWKGKGYIAKKSSPSSMSMGMIIGGGYFGGYNSNTGNVSPTQVSGTTATNTISTPGPETVRFYSHSPASAEPVDMASGAYFYDRADLALGGEAPLGLAFTRSYDSGLNLSQGSLGYGWTHNLDMRLSRPRHCRPPCSVGPDEDPGWRGCMDGCLPCRQVGGGPGNRQRRGRSFREKSDGIHKAAGRKLRASTGSDHQARERLGNHLQHRGALRSSVRIQCGKPDSAHHGLRQQCHDI
jgi:hypothetical protein